MRTALLIPVLIALLLAACQDSTPPAVHIEEASGAAYYDGQLLVVDDAAPGTYFRIALPEDTPPGTVITLNEANPVKVDLPNLSIWIDLEGIERLADGRIIVLSEVLRSIVGVEGVIAEYDYPLGAVGRRGLEGVAVEPLPDGSSRVAVVWEGGYPDPGSLNPELEERNRGLPLLPVVFVHDVAPDASALGRLPWGSAQKFALQVPVPEGTEPDAQRFRAPDLVWHRLPGRDEMGFIVLLSSQNAGDQRQFLHHWLQRFDSAGEPVGDPLDIAAVAPAEIGDANWEGLCWLAPGRTLVLVHEGLGSLPAHALVVELPPDWRF